MATILDRPHVAQEANNQMNGHKQEDVDEIFDNDNKLVTNHQTKETQIEPSRAWWKEATVYQIYPASFKDSTGNGRGDIPGITSKVDYIKSLGAEIVWLSPVYKSPQADMGYDISDYKQIDEHYGTLSDMDGLIKALHDRGMRCVMDLVVNHTSIEHEWFKKSRMSSSEDDEYRDWYIWRKPKFDKTGARLPPNNWLSIFGGSAWTYDDVRQEYYLHIFLEEQPDLNWEHPPVREAVKDIMRFWLDRGCDGFRLDAINFISKSPGLPDGNPEDEYPQYMGTKHYCMGPRLHEWLAELGVILDKYDAFSVGEMGATKDMADILKSVARYRHELGMVIHFELMMIDHGAEGIYSPYQWELMDWKKITERWQTFMYENDGWNAIYMENHDQSRTVSRFASDHPEKRTICAKMLATYMGFLAGTIFLYQGQEIGMANVPDTWDISEYKDIATQNYWREINKKHPGNEKRLKDARQQINMKCRDNGRTPVQWDATQHSGFTTGTPWMRVNDDYPEWNVEAQLKNPKSVFSYWQSILKLRKEYQDIFVYGSFELLLRGHKQLFVYARRYESQEAVVVINFSNTKCAFPAKDVWGGRKTSLLLSDVAEIDLNESRMMLEPFVSFVCLLEDA